MMLPAWTSLLIAGVLEVIWALGLKSTGGFSRFWPSAGVFLVMALSVYFLSQAVKGMPIGTAYAVWTGIGAAGTALFGVFLFGEPFHFFRILCIIFIIFGAVGLRFFG